MENGPSGSLSMRHQVIRIGFWPTLAVVEGVPDAVRLEAGDCFLLPRGRPFCLASDMTLTPVDAYTLFQLPLNGAIRSVNGGGDCFGVGGHFTVTGKHADILLEVPPIVNINPSEHKPLQLFRSSPLKYLLCCSFPLLIFFSALYCPILAKCGNRSAIRRGL